MAALTAHGERRMTIFLDSFLALVERDFVDGTRCRAGRRSDWAETRCARVFAL
jgi:hypothetical protein